MTAVANDHLVRVAIAVRSAAAVAARGNADDLARGGYSKEASARNGAAHDVSRINVEAIVAATTEQAPPAGQLDAFYAAARANNFNTSHRDDGSFIYPQTQNAFNVWLAAVRFDQINSIDRSPAPQDKAGTGVAAD
jgi:hypothetical protein